MYKSKFTGQEIDDKLTKIDNIENETQTNTNSITKLTNKTNDLQNKSLQIPTTAPTSTKLVGIDTNKTQINIDIGGGLILENGIIKSTGGESSGGILTVTESYIDNPSDESENLVYCNGSVYCLIKED